MKILIAYDGSEFSKNAIEDLTRAGLPREGVDATVLSVGEVRSTSDLNLEPALSIASYAVDNIQETIQFAREAAEEDASEGVRMVQKVFPSWNVVSCARLHSPASTILEIADDWKPDLIVMGSHGRGAIGRLFLGSVSLRVASEARCSVRIVRKEDRPAPVPTLLLSFDGSRGAREVVHKMIHRSWPSDTKLHIVTVINISVLATPEYVWLAGSDVGIYQEMQESRIEHALLALEQEMKKHFRDVTTSMPVGMAGREILAEAKRVNAGTIFIGSRGLSGLQRMLLGSVAHSVAAHAEQTVEIVR